jgi:membrane-associated phospholipid phosphatase
MIRLLFTTCISLALLMNGYAQDDTTLKKDNDSVSVDTTRMAADSIVVGVDTTTTMAQPPVVQRVPKKRAPANGEVYKLNPAVDIPLTAVTAGWSIYAFPKIYDKPGISEAEIRNLNKQNINGFDRWAADVWHENAEATSDIFFYASIPLPLVLLIDKEIRKDAAKIGFLYLEAMSVTGLFYTGSAYLWDRFRPLTYYSDFNKLPMHERTSGNERNAFLGGHPALVATSTFFIASVYGDYHPDSKFKYVLYGGAALATGATAYLRHRAGKHFPSDLIVGTTVGTLSGLLVPRLHRNKAYANSKVRIMPFTGESHGLYVVYKL